MKGAKAMKKEITMQEVLHALWRELGYDEGSRVYEWYCYVYCVGAGDIAPVTVRYEVFGF